MQLSRMQWILVIMGLAVAFIFYSAFTHATISIEWNNLVNGILQDTFAVALGSIVTIIIYRYVYHGRQKN